MSNLFKANTAETGADGKQPGRVHQNLLDASSTNKSNFSPFPHSSFDEERLVIVKLKIMSVLYGAFDFTQFGKLEHKAAHDEMCDVIDEIIMIKGILVSRGERERLVELICADILSE